MGRMFFDSQESDAMSTVWRLVSSCRRCPYHLGCYLLQVLLHLPSLRSSVYIPLPVLRSKCQAQVYPPAPSALSHPLHRQYLRLLHKALQYKVQQQGLTLSLPLSYYWLVEYHRHTPLDKERSDSSPLNILANLTHKVQGVRFILFNTL